MFGEFSQDKKHREVFWRAHERRAHFEADAKDLLNHMMEIDPKYTKKKNAYMCMHTDKIIVHQFLVATPGRSECRRHVIEKT